MPLMLKVRHNSHFLTYVLYVLFVFLRLVNFNEPGERF